ncbi:amidohydrolase [Humibacter ginsenosidimutans]|uniref:Amidohydrolase n=1 Tax=Humibacter ginsenosidimutans TaxID=2599293 RepID=A0A5B8M7R9_9MICO|nr:amidohydrolase [Humibacter ginsenosidimutans]QDZ15490.1 amidohydrolase [Humibacter ginsenosidimutans]
MAQEGTAAEAVLTGLAELREWQEGFYTNLHEHPELGNQEVNTAASVAEALEGFGYEVHDKIGTTGVVGILKNGDGPVVLMRADMDALPIAEATGLPYASTVRMNDANGENVPVMHACGHDVHVSCLLGAARLLAEKKDAWRGTYIALFQPAEELADGADVMLKGGLADLIPHPEVALAQHVLPLPAGHVGTRAGAFLSSGDSMRVTVWGRGSHGSMPQLSVDPVVLAATIVLRLQGIVAREIAPGEFAVVTVGRMVAGSKSNIISDHAVLELNIRTFSETTRTTIVNAVHRIVEGECATSGSPQPPTFELYDHYPVTENDSTTTATVAEAFSGYFGDLAFTIDRQSASEDFSEIPDALGVPYCYWGLGGADPDLYAKAEAAGTVATDIPANHSPKFAPVIEPTLQNGTAAAVVAAMAWLGRED